MPQLRVEQLVLPIVLRMRDAATTSDRMAIVDDVTNILVTKHYSDLEMTEFWNVVSSDAAVQLKESSNFQTVSLTELAKQRLIVIRG